VRGRGGGVANLKKRIERVPAEEATIPGDYLARNLKKRIERYNHLAAGW